MHDRHASTLTTRPETMRDRVVGRCNIVDDGRRLISAHPGFGNNEDVEMVMRNDIVNECRFPDGGPGIIEPKTEACRAWVWLNPAQQ